MRILILIEKSISLIEYSFCFFVFFGQWGVGTHIHNLQSTTSQRIKLMERVMGSTYFDGVKNNSVCVFVYINNIKFGLILIYHILYTGFVFQCVR